MNKPVIDVVHFSDVLCVWAYISQIRVEELQTNYPDKIRLNYRFMQVFGDVSGKMATQWADRGGLPGYSAHVQEVAGQFEHIFVNPQVWLENTPTSSLPAHLLLCGVKVLSANEPDELEQGLLERLLKRLRHAFFVDVIDISNRQKLFELAEDVGVDTAKLQQVLENGKAFARLAEDLATATQTPVRASPTISFNEGRQVFTGNVGYRVLDANMRELLRSPADQQSWC